MKQMLCAILLLAVLIGCAQPPENLPRAQVEEVVEETVMEAVEPQMSEKNVTAVRVDMTGSTFEFEGYAPGKSHVGTFKNVSGVLLVSNGVIVGAKGMADVSSVSTGIGQLNKHLQSGDFFDVAKYPTIEFESKSIKAGMLTGVLMFRGVQKELSIPVNMTNVSLSGEFLLDVTPFNFKYVGINKDVRVKFDVMLP